MFYQLMPLQWGLVNLSISVDGVDPRSRILPPIEGGALSKGVVGSSQVSRVGGRGRVKRVRGSGIVKSVGGRGRLCR